MRLGLYLRLARMNLSKNRKLYVPYLLTGVCMVMVFYIVYALAVDPDVKEIPGGDTLTMLLGFGVYVIGLFSTLFLFYISGFLTKQRKRELGLYNVLGMGKRHIARVMFYENTIIAGVCVIGGILLGVVFSKLAQLCLMRMMEVSAPFNFMVPFKPIMFTLIVYLCAFALVHLNALRQLAKSNVIELLNSSASGEKPPKGNIFISLFGALCLFIGYYMALSVDNPISTFFLFFIAVLFVIAGTYALFISGSVAVCKVLKRNKRYYYKAANFLSVSGMAYRMKRNGAGLASICILSTMVLVVMSSVTCLFMGAEDTMRVNYPRDMEVHAWSDAAQRNTKLIEITDNKLAEFGYTPKDILKYSELSFGAVVRDGVVNFEQDDWDAIRGKYSQVDVMSLEDFNLLANKTERLSQGEAIVVPGESLRPYEWDTIAFQGGETYTARVITDVVFDRLYTSLGNYNQLLIVLPDIADVFSAWRTQKLGYGDYSSGLEMIYAFNLSAGNHEQIVFHDALLEDIREYSRAAYVGGAEGGGRYSVRSSASNRDEFYSMYAGLFFLGVVLGMTFAVASVLIMYYKQVTEGYEDQARFTIMQHVGITSDEIKKSINAQVLIVFFLPLVASVTHLLFAYPMIKQLLSAFGLTNSSLFLMVTCASILVFSALYACVYRVTSRAYLSIVSARGDARVYGV